MNAFIITKVVDARGLGIQALMLDVDGVLIDGRPEDGRHWQTSIDQAQFTQHRAQLLYMKVIGKRPRAHRS